MGRMGGVGGAHAHKKETGIKEENEGVMTKTYIFLNNNC